MQIQVSILHKDYPADVRERIEDKCQSLTRFCNRIISMRALVERDKDEHRVELIAHLGQGNPLIADSRGEVFGATLDEAFDRMSRLVKRHTEMRTIERRRTARVRH